MQLFKSNILHWFDFTVVDLKAPVLPAESGNYSTLLAVNWQINSYHFSVWFMQWCACTLLYM